MNDVFLCVTALFLLGWVIYLKLLLGQQHEQIDQLTERLKRVMRQTGQEVETGDDMAVWGQRPPWLK